MSNTRAITQAEADELAAALRELEESMLPTYVCAHCRKQTGEPLLNLKPAAARRYGLPHQSVHPSCRREIHAARKVSR